MDKEVGEFTAELPALRKDGTTLQTEVTATSLWEEDGRYGGHVCIVRDITERKNLERQRSDFFAMVTHDLKSPLTTILGYTELISEKAKDKKEKDIAEMAKVAFQSGKKLLRLVEDFMAAARVEANGVQLCLLPEELSGLLREVRDDFEPLAKKKSITFRVDIPDGLPSVFLDRKQVERAVGNLLQNAFNYTPKGGEITLRAETTLRGENKYIMVSVSDTGPGIPYDEHEKIFKKYYRSPKAAGPKGTGLGLAIVKAIAEEHGGSVEVESEEGKGSTFRLFLPVDG
jgi:signal transduction histidine kinase